MSAPDLLNSTREERLSFVKEEWKCLGNCRVCGKCAFLRGREAEEIYADYIEGLRDYREITIEQRDRNY